jgi:hypothetical protein
MVKMISLFLTNKFVNYIIIPSHIKSFLYFVLLVFSGFKGSKPNSNPYDHTETKHEPKT